MALPMPYTRPGGTKGMLKKSDFIYDEFHDCYLCPEDRVLAYTTTTRDGYREYHSDPKHCRACPLLGQCTKSKTATKTVQRHVWEEHKEAVREHRFETHGKALYKRRKETVERSFADAKQLHGHRYARYRGIHRVREHCWLAAACQNMKKIAPTPPPGNPKGPNPALQPLPTVIRLAKGPAIHPSALPIPRPFPYQTRPCT